MDRVGLWSLLLVALLYLCFGTSLVSGKCAGRWAIHACGGGNGKRSDQKLTPDTDSSADRNKLLLERLLLHKANNQQVPQYTENTGEYSDSDEAKSSEAQQADRRSSEQDSGKLWRNLLAALKAKYKMTS